MFDSMIGTLIQEQISTVKPRFGRYQATSRWIPEWQEAEKSTDSYNRRSVRTRPLSAAERDDEETRIYEQRSWFHTIFKNHLVGGNQDRFSTSIKLLSSIHVQTVEDARRTLEQLRPLYEQVFEERAGHSRYRNDPASILRNEAQESFRKLHRAVREEKTAYQMDNALTALHEMREHLVQAQRLSEFNSQISEILQMQEQVASMTASYNNLKSITDWTRMNADGIGRTNIHYISPKALTEMLTNGRYVPILDESGNVTGSRKTESWIDTTQNAPVADFVVVGAGPAGLAAAYYLARRGLRTILLEGSTLGASFSNSGAQAIHWIRTNEDQTSIALQGIADPDVVDEIGMRAVSAREGFGKKADEGRADLEAATGGRRIVGKSRFVESIQRPDDPITRSQLFQYLVHVGDKIAEFDNAFVIEQAPIKEEGINKNNRTGLFEVETTKGHKIKARNVIMATGAVGPYSQFADLPDQLLALEKQNPNRYITFRNHHELADLDKMKALREFDYTLAFRDQNGLPAKQLIFTDATLGTPQIQHYVHHLRPGFNMLVVGSGESAAKAAIELTILNPGLTVTMLVKRPLEPAQVQVPAYNFNAETIKSGIFDPLIGRELIREWKEDFDTPITPETLNILLELQQAGKMRIYEMGKKVSPETIEFRSIEVPDEQPHRKRIVTQVLVTDPGVIQNIKRQGVEWESFGVKSSPEGRRLDDGGYLLAEIDGGIVTAGGYNRISLNQDPTIQHLVNTGILHLSEPKGRKGQQEIEYNLFNHLTATGDTNFAVIGAANHNGTASDSAIPGMTSRAMYTTDLMVNNLIEDANDAYRKYRRAGSSNIFDAANATRLARTIDPPDLSVPHTYNNRRQFPDPSPEAMNPALIELAAMLEQFPSPVIRTLLEAGKEYPTDKWMREARTRQRLSQATQDHQKPSVNLSPELALMLKRADDLKARLEASKQRRRSNPDFTRR